MKRLLFVTHQLTRTGAPIVLLDLAEAAIQDGYQVDYYALADGELRNEVEAMGIRILHANDYENPAESFFQLVDDYDGVVVNTLAAYWPILILCKKQIPVIWWLHEGEQYFDFFKKELPDFKQLPTNIHVYSVSSYVQEVVSRRLGIWTPILHFGVKDVAAETSDHANNLWEKFDPGHQRIRFLTVGLYSRIKGQDILTHAIKMLSESLREQAVFVFCGDEENAKEDVLGEVKSASEEFAGVYHIGKKSREEVFALMAGMDFGIIPSRVDPMPTVAAEAMMLSKPILISDVCGVAHDVTDRYDSFLFHSEDVADLTNRLETLIKEYTDGRNGQRKEEMNIAARELYDRCYAKAVFLPKIKRILRNAIGRRKLIITYAGKDKIDIFMEHTEPVFIERGYEVFPLHIDNLQEELPRLANFLQTGVTAIIAFNHTAMEFELVEGKNTWEELGIPFIDIVVDHPFAHKRALDYAGANVIALVNDRNHMSYLQRFYPHLAGTGFLAHGGCPANLPIKPLEERKIDMIYAGNLLRIFVEQIKPDFRQFDFDAESIAKEAYEKLIAEPDYTTEEILEERLLAHGVKLPDPELCEVIEKLHYIDLMATSYYREAAVRAFVMAGIDVEIYGSGWEECDWIKDPHAHYRGRVPAQEVVVKMHESKLVLSTMTWFKDGTHDRVFNGMLAGAVVVSDTSIYMKENFDGIYESEGCELLMFELKKNAETDSYPDIPQMAQKVKKLLETDEETLQKIADRGRVRAIRSETCEARARELDDDLIQGM